jgi:hypothetical protein
VKLSREALETRLRATEDELTHTTRALCDVIGGKVEWFRNGRYRAGLIRPLSACGGTLIVRFLCRGQSPTTTAHSLEGLYRRVVETPQGSTDTESLRAVVYQAMTRARQIQHETEQKETLCNQPI